MDFYEKELDTSKVMVLSQDTWNRVRDNMAQKAVDSGDPITYSQWIDGLEIVIDNDLPLDFVEVYEKWMYEAMKIFGKLEE